MVRGSWVMFAWLVGCAQAGATHSVGPGDAGTEGAALPCGGGGEGCCAKRACRDGLVCNAFSVCARPMPDAGEGGETCPFVECAGVCTDTMSDSKSCGACGHDCQGNSCVSGLCLATGIAVGGSPVNLAVDDTNVYFTDGNGSVSSAPKGGGTVGELVKGVANPYGIALAPPFVYFTSQGTLASGYTDGAVLKVPYGGVGDGGAATAIATSRPEPQALVLDATHVYWLELGTSTDNGSLLSCPLAGCPSNTPTVLYDMLALPYGLAIDDTNLYVTTSAGGQILVFSKATGTPSVLISMQNEPAGITVVDGTLYWATTGDGLIQSMATTGGASTFVATTMGNPKYVAADAVNVYWSDSHPKGTFGPVDSCVVGGCPPANPVTLVNISQTATAIALDSLFVYWVGTGGQVLRVAK